MAKNSDGTLKTVFKIDGEAEYTRAVKNMNSELRVLSSEMKEVDSRFDKNEKSMRKLKAQNEVLNKQYDTQTKKVSTLKDAVANSTKAYDNAVDVYNEMVNKFGEQSKEAERAAKNVDKAKDSVTKFSIELNKAQADLNKTEAALKENNKELRNLKNIKLTDLVPDEMVEKVEELQENFKKVTAAANGVASACGKAALEAGKLGANTLKGTLEAGTKALTAYAGAASAAATAIFNVSAEAGLFADDINTLSKQTGLDTSTLQEYTYATSLIDVEVETIAKSMAKLTKNMTSTSSEVQGAFDTLGVSIRDNVTGELRNNEEVFNELITALGKVENETQRDNLAMQIFGKSAQDLNPLILGGAEQLTELAESARNAGLILSQDTLDSLNAFNDSIDVLKGNLTASGRILASAFAGDLQKFTDKIGKAIPDLSKAVSGMFDPETAEESEREFKRIIRDLSEDIGRDIEAMLPTFLNAINGITSSVIEVLPDSVMTLLPYLIDGLTQLVTDLVHQMPTLLPELAQGAVDLFMGIISGFNTVIAELTPLLPGIISDLTDILVDNLPLMIRTSYQLFIGLINGLATAAPEILKAVGEFATTAAGEITKGENLNALIQAGIDLVVAIAEGMPQALPQLISALGSVISDLLNAEVGYEDMGKIGLSLGEALVDSFSSVLGVIDSMLGTKTQEIYNTLQSWGAALGDWIYQAQNADLLAAQKDRVENSAIDTDIIRISNQYMREGMTPEEALEKAKAEILDTASKQNYFDLRLKNRLTVDEATKRFSVLQGTGQIGNPDYYDNSAFVNANKEKVENAQHTEEEISKTIEREAEKYAESLNKEVEAVEKSYDKEIAALGKRSNAQKESREDYLNNLKEMQANELAEFEKTSEKIIDTLQKRHSAELGILESAHNTKLAIYNKEYMEQLKITDEERYNAIKAIDDEISAINAKTEAEEKASAELEKQQRLNQLTQKVYSAGNVEERAKAEKELADYKAELERAAVLEERELRIAELENRKADINTEYDAKMEAINAEYEKRVEKENEAFEIQSENLKLSQESEKAVLEEKIAAEKIALEESHEAALNALLEENEQAISYIDKQRDAKIKAIQEEKEEAIKAIEERNAKDIESYKETLREKAEAGEDIGYIDLPYSHTAAYYEQMGKAALAEKEFNNTANTASSFATTATGHTNNTHTEVVFNNYSPKALSAHEQLMQNARQATVAAIYTGK